MTIEPEIIGDCTLYNGDAIQCLKQIADASVDCVIIDPPYAEIDRPYGRLTEPQWHELMNAVVIETRRILKPTGSAVFILQPNSERVGRMRPWLWEFMAKWTREWNMVQDAWWWNYTSPPTVHCQRIRGLMRPSLKACVWFGEPECYRKQDAVLWETSNFNPSTLERRALQYSPQGGSYRRGRMFATAVERGGSTPFNVLPVCVTPNKSNETRQSATTPPVIADWWTRYLCPPNGTVCDPFIGSGTVGLAAIARDCSVIGIERDEGYFGIACNRIREAYAKRAELLPMPA